MLTLEMCQRNNICMVLEKNGLVCPATIFFILDKIFSKIISKVLNSNFDIVSQYSGIKSID